VVQAVFLLLETHELVKVRLPSGLGKQRKGCAEALAEATQSSCVSLVGRNVLLYRPSRDLDPKKRIALP
jgi:RNA-binding protein